MCMQFDYLSSVFFGFFFRFEVCRFYKHQQIFKYSKVHSTFPGQKIEVLLRTYFVDEP